MTTASSTPPPASPAEGAALFTAPPTPPAPEVHIARLPATGGELFGRDAELSWLDACWDEGVRVASIVASGGVGKSSLVNGWLRRMDGAGWRGATRVYGWSFYSQGTDRLASSDVFFAEALREFGDTEEAPTSPWAKGERLAALVRRERAVLVLDGVEPLQWGPGVQEGRLKDPALLALVKELGGQNRGLCIITSRIALTEVDTGDKVWVKDLGHLCPEAGAELLKARGAKGTEEELRVAAGEYKGHGLALTLLGSYLAEVAGGDIQRRKEVGPLEEDERLGGHARRVMRSYEKWLRKPEVAILRMIGLFDRPTEEDEVAVLRAKPAIVGLTAALVTVNERDWNKAVTKLVRLGLLAERDKKLDAHPLVRQHFGEQLKRKQPEAWREGHRRLYEHLKKKAKPLPETVEEMAPLYAAVVHGCQAGKSQEALDDVYWKRVNRERDGFNAHKLGAFGSEVAVLSAFFDPPWERLAPGLNEADQAFVLHEAGYALRALGRLPEAAGLMRLGLEQHIAHKAWNEAATGTANLSELLQSRGELSEALAQGRKAVDFADKGGDAFRRINNMTTLAAALHAMGLWGEAATQFEEAERMQKENWPNRPHLDFVWCFLLCDLLLDRGCEGDVLVRASRDVTWAKTGNWVLCIALDHLSLGRAHLLAVQRGAAGDLAQAASHLTQAVDGLRRAGHQEMLPLGLLARAALRTHTHAFDLAHRDLDEALTLATRCGFRLHEADAHLGLARLSLAEGHPTAARDHLAKARAIIDQTGYHRRNDELTQLEAEAAAMPSPPPPPPPDAPPPAPIPKQRTPVPTPAAPPAFDIAIVCALRRPELEKVLATGKQPWTTLPRDGGDPTTYRATTFDRAGGPALSVVAAAPGQMGMAASAALATKMVQRHRPKLVAMVGIAAGVDGSTQGFGDILAPATTFDYGAGKIGVVDGKLHLHPDANPISVVPILRDRLEEWSLEEPRLAAIRAAWPGAKPNTVLKLHVGPLGSGAAVIAARETVDATKEHWRKLIGLEMEAYGVHHASQLAVHPPPMFLCMKSICDFAGPDKDDRWQDYAAYTAAQLCHLFLTEEWDTLFPR